MWLIKASLRNPYMVATLVFMMIFLGALAMVNIPVDILPAFKAPAVQVLTYYAGMPASAIEKTITNRIERWVNQGPGVQRIESKSVPGVSVVKLYFRDDIDPNAALTLTTSLAQGTLPTLPPNTLPPVTLPFDPTGTFPLGILTVSNPDLDEARVKDVARIDVRNMLGAVPGCVAPVVIGGKDRTVLVYLRPKDMEIRNVSPLDVVRALRRGNQMVTPGIAYFGKDQILLDTNVMVEKVDELNEFPIRTVPGDRVYLKDVGHAEDAYAIQTSRVRITDENAPNGRRQVYVPIYRQQGASSLAVANGVKAAIDRMEKQLPPGTRLHFVMDQSLYVKEAIVSLIHEGMIGIVLVAAMILFFLGNLRMTMIASLSIPLAICTAVVGLYVTGNSINAMTLGGLALAIGPLVDDSIVALENIHRHFHMRKSRVQAALDGSVEVMVPVLVATCTTIIVLSPLALMPGMGGFLFRPLALAVAFAMLASFLLSRTFVPMMCSKLLPKTHRHGPGHTIDATHVEQVSGEVLVVSDQDGTQTSHESPVTTHLTLADRIQVFLIRATRGYERLLLWALRHRALALGAVGLLFLGSLMLLIPIGREFFPQVDAGQITVHVRAPSRSRLDETERRIIDVERFLEEKIPATDREMIVSEIGLDPDWSAAYSDNSGQQDTVIRVQLSEKRRFSAQEYALLLRRAFEEESKRFGDLRLSFETGGMVSTALNNGASSPIDIQIAGGTPKQADALARDIRKRVAAIRGTADVKVLQRLDAPYLLFDVDRKKAADFGLSAEDVVLQLVAAMNSSVSINRNFWIDEKSGNQYFVAVQYPENPNMTLDDVLNIYATGTNQPHGVKLGQLVQVRHRNDAVEVNHVSLYPTFNILLNTQNRDIGHLGTAINKALVDVRADLNDRIAKADARVQELRGAGKANPVARSVDHGPTSAAELKAAQAELNGLKSLHWDLRGEYARMQESASSLAKGLAAAAVLVYLLMVALFRSWMGPLIIMFTVPLGWIGVLTMLYVTGTSLNVQSVMGVIFLVGIGVNNGVLLVDFANKQRKLGAPLHQAITVAATIRFRPIMMTFLATFLDLVPMAIGFGKGSEANVPLARAVVGGLLTATVFTLFVIPSLYTLLLRDPLPPETDLEGELSGGQGITEAAEVPPNGQAPPAPAPVPG
jgi:multidrug efflux pump subunit AcrB